MARLLGVMLGAAVVVSTAFPFVGVVAQQRDFQLLRLGNGFVKWGDPSLGSGATINYSFVSRPTHVADARNCGDIVPIGGLLAASQVSWQAFRVEVSQALAMWERAADVRFSYVEDAESADILIGAQGAPRGHAFTNVAYDRDDGARVGRLTQSLVCLNPLLPWKIGFDGNVDVYDLRYTIAHEIGHAIGLNHPGPSGQLMSFRYEERFRDLQEGDRMGAIALYGPRLPAARRVNY